MLFQLQCQLVEDAERADKYPRVVPLELDAPRQPHALLTDIHVHAGLLVLFNVRADSRRQGAI